MSFGPSHPTAPGRGTRALAAALAAAVTLTLALAPGAIAKLEPVGGGKTELGIRSALRDLLADSGTKLKAIDPAKLKQKRKLSLPIKKGELDDKKAKGKLRQDGGLELNGPGGKLRLKGFLVKLGKGSKLKAKDGNKNVPVADLDTGKAKVKAKGGKTKLTGVKAILTSKGTALIEEVTEQELDDDTVLGKLKVSAKAGDVSLKDGSSNLKLDSSTSGALTTAGITSGPIDPATRKSGKLKFPITGGKVGVDGQSGIVRLDGGLRLARGTTSLDLTKLRISFDDGKVTALVAGNRVTVLSLDVADASTKVKGEVVTITDVAATLTAEGATAINEAFGTAFTAGAAFGTFKVKGTTKG